MRNDILNPIVLAFELDDALEWLFKHIKLMPLPQAIIVATALGLGLGHFVQGSLGMLLEVLRWLTLVVVFGLGSVTLYLLHYERRRIKNLMMVAVVLLMLSSIELVLGRNTEIIAFLNYMINMSVTAFIFILAVHSYRFTKGDSTCDKI